MNFFGKCEFLEKRTGESANGAWESQVILMSDPNSDQQHLLEVFGNDRIEQLKNQGMVNGAVGTIHIYSTVKTSAKGTRFNSERPTRWEPVVAVGASEANDAHEAVQTEDPLEF